MVKKGLMFFLLYSLIATYFVYGQQQNRLAKGVVYNEKNDALSFATINSLNGKYSTTTNEKGEFIIYLPSTENNLIVSYLGYTNDTIKLNDLNHYYNVSLSPYTFTLNEATVEANTPVALIKKAVKAISKNYPQHNINMEGFYREKLEVNSEIYSFSEAYLAIIRSYKKNAKEKKYLLKNRSFLLSSTDSLQVDMVFSSDKDIAKNSSLFFDSNFFNNNEFSFDTASFYNDRLLYNIKIKPRTKHDGVQGNIFIDRESLAFVKIDVEYIIQKPLYYNGVVKKSVECSYQIYDNKWYLSSSSFIGEQWYRKKNSTFKVVGNTRFIVTSISKQLSEYNNAPLMNEGDILSYYPSHYDSLFWDNKIILLPDPTVESKLISFKSAEPQFALTKSSLPKQNDSKLLYYPSIELWLSSDSPNNLTALSKNLAALNGLTYYASDRYLRQPYGMVANFLYSFGFSIPFGAVEAERRLLAKNGIKSSYNPTIYNKYLKSYSNHVSDDEIISLKNENFGDFMRLHTIRDDMNHLMIKQIEEKFASTDMNNKNVRNNYLSYYYFDLFVRRIFFANNILSQFDILNNGSNTTNSRSPIFFDRQKSFVKYLHDPNYDFSRAIKKSDLTDREQKYLTSISWKSLINWASLPMLAISFGNDKIQYTGSLSHILTPFGEMFEQNLWLKAQSQTFGFFIREYKNYDRLGVGLGVKLYDYSISKKLLLQTAVDYWYQPDNLSFYDTKFTQGFGIAQQLQIKLKEDIVNHLGDLSIFLSYELKTKGYLTSSNSLGQDISFSIGFKYNFTR